MKKKELIDAIASGSKLTKADAGRLINQTNDFYNTVMAQYSFTDATTLKIIKKIITAKADGSKLTKADAG
ncbi:hypothetical protein [Flavobacterium sp.]|uniref:hypothetical protein n=1 Tax=Flavobacterium sp. TaxID=239 RepID=UPI00374D3252